MIKSKIFGIEIGVSVGFMCMLCIMLYIDRTGYMLMAIEAIALHETGHLIMLYILGHKPKKLELKIGAAEIGGRFLLTRRGEILVALAGSVGNLLAFGILFFAYWLWGSRMVLKLALVMLIMGVFNLLPIQGLDGGTVVYQLMVGKLSSQRMKRMIFTLSFLFIGLIFLLGMAIFLGSEKNPSLMLLAIYLVFGILLSKKQNND